MASTLQAIVTNGGGRLHGGLDVAGLDRSPFGIGVVRTDSGKAVGLLARADEVIE